VLPYRALKARKRGGAWKSKAKRKVEVWSVAVQCDRVGKGLVVCGGVGACGGVMPGVAGMGGKGTGG